MTNRINDRHQMNLGFNQEESVRGSDLKSQPLFVVNYYSQQTGERPHRDIDQRRLKELNTSKPFNQRTKSVKRFHRSKEEARLKTFYAEELMNSIAREDLSYSLASYKTNISVEKLFELSKSNISRVSLYELLRALTTFGYDARICLRPTSQHLPGDVIPDL